MSTRRPRIPAILITALLVAALPMTAAAARPITPPGPSVISWSGYQWNVKQHSRKIGPGPNFFSSANVAVVGDALHLSIKRSGNRWYAAEVINTSTLGYGTYSWTVGRMGPLDPQVVLGLFTWNDDPAFNHREIDIEFARWSYATDPTNGQWVVQPYSTTGNLLRTTQPATATSSTHRFTWGHSTVDFASTSAQPRSWTYDGPDVPHPGGENARMNLWQFRGQAPSNGQPIEIVITDFTYAPLP